MILGIGSDIVNISRLKEMYDAFSERTLERILTAKERQEFKDRAEKNQENAIRFLAKRFAAKEACAKALGCGIGSELSFQDMEILNDSLGRPLLTLSSSARNRFLQKHALYSTLHIHLTLSDDAPYALAMVVVEG